MAGELEPIVLKQDTGFMSGLGSLINSIVDEIVVILVVLGYIVMAWEQKAIPQEYTAVTMILITDYVKKKWNSEM